MISMIDLREAFKLTKVQNGNIVYLRPYGANRFNSILATGRQVREQYDMRKLKVVSIQPRFERFGPDYMGMEFTVIGLKNKEEK